MQYTIIKIKTIITQFSFCRSSMSLLISFFLSLPLFFCCLIPDLIPIRKMTYSYVYPNQLEAGCKQETTMRFFDDFKILTDGKKFEKRTRSYLSMSLRRSLLYVTHSYTTPISFFS